MNMNPELMDSSSSNSLFQNSPVPPKNPTPAASLPVASALPTILPPSLPTVTLSDDEDFHEEPVKPKKSKQTKKPTEEEFPSFSKVKPVVIPPELRVFQQQHYIPPAKAEASSSTSQAATSNGSPAETNIAATTPVFRPQVVDYVDMEKKVRKEINNMNQVIETQKAKLKSLYNKKENEALKAYTDRVNSARNRLGEVSAKLEQMEQEKTSIYDNLKDKLQTLKTEIKTGTDQKEAQVSQKKSIEARITDLKQKVTALKSKLPYASMVDYDREIAKLKNQLKKQNVKEKLAQELTKKIDELEKSKVKYQEYYEMWEEYVTEQQKLQKVSESIEQADIEIKQRIAKVTDYSKSLEEIEKAQDAPSKQQEFEKLTKDKQDLVKEFIAAKAEKNKKKNELMEQNRELYEQRRTIKEQLEKEKKKRQVLQDQIESFKKHITTHKLTVAPEQVGALFGKKGETLKNLKAKTQADINVLKESNTVIIKGLKESADAAFEEVKKLLESNKKDVAYIPFKPELIDVVSYGANLKYFKDVSGISSIFVNRLEGQIKIIGSKAAIGKAKKEIEEFLKNQAFEKAELPFPAGMQDIVVGRGGETIRAIKNESGADKLNVNAEKGVIEIEGARESVQYAKDKYEKLLKRMSEANHHMNVGKDHIGAVIGKNGSTIRKIEQKSKAFVKIDKETGRVEIRGSKKNVEVAQKEIESAISESKQQQKQNTQTKQAALVTAITKSGEKYLVQVLAGDNKVCGAIIGKEGTTVNGIQQESGASVRVNNKTKIVDITGPTEESVAKAQKLVNDIVEKFKPKESASTTAPAAPAASTATPVTEEVESSATTTSSPSSN